MFNVEIREATENKYIKVENKEGFIDLISTLYDTMANDIESRQEIEEEVFWAELLTGYLSVFKTKDEFFEWIENMGELDLIQKDFDYQDYKQELISDAVREETNCDCYTLSDLTDALDRMKDAFNDIHAIADEYR